MGFAPLCSSVSVLGYARASERRSGKAGGDSPPGRIGKAKRERQSCALYRRLGNGAGRLSSPERYLQRSLCLYEDLGDESGIAASLNALAVSARDRGDYASAQSNFERSLACWRLLPDPMAIARCLHNLANVVKVRGDYPRARWALREATEIFEELGDRNGAAWSINQQGDIEREQGHLAEARALYEGALAVFQKLETRGAPAGRSRISDTSIVSRARIWLRARLIAKPWKSLRVWDTSAA